MLSHRPKSRLVEFAVLILGLLISYATSASVPNNENADLQNVTTPNNFAQEDWPWSPLDQVSEIPIPLPERYSPLRFSPRDLFRRDVTCNGTVYAGNTFCCTGTAANKACFSGDGCCNDPFQCCTVGSICCTTVSGCCPAGFTCCSASQCCSQGQNCVDGKCVAPLVVTTSVIGNTTIAATTVTVGATVVQQYTLTSIPTDTAAACTNCTAGGTISTGAKAGIGVGVAAAVAIIAGLVAYGFKAGFFSTHRSQDNVERPTADEKRDTVSTLPEVDYQKYNQHHMSWGSDSAPTILEMPGDIPSTEAASNPIYESDATERREINPVQEG